MQKVAAGFAATQLNHTFADLGMSPLANSYLKEEQLLGMEPFFPLHVYVCEKCHLVQLPEYQSPETFLTIMPIFLPTRIHGLSMPKTYTDLMIQRFGFDANSQCC